MTHTTRGRRYSKRSFSVKWPKVPHTEKKEREPKVGGIRHFKPSYRYKESGKPVPGEKKGLYRWLGPDIGWVKESIVKKWRKK